MAIDFPSSPTNGTTYTYPTTGVTYTYVASGSSGYWTVLTSGTVGVATPAEVTALTDNVKYVTPYALTGLPDATTSQKGLTKYADASDIAAGTATDLAITPAALAASGGGGGGTGGVDLTTDQTVNGEKTFSDLRLSSTTVRLGSGSGSINQGAKASAVGLNSGKEDQGDDATSIGNEAGETRQGSNAFAGGYGAGQTDQGVSAVSLGPLSGNDTQGNEAVGIGFRAGQTNQGERAVSLGSSSGRNNQGDFGVAIGYGAALNDQGSDSIAIGHSSGANNQGANGIIISSTGVVEEEISEGHITVASNKGSIKFTEASAKFTFSADVDAPNVNAKLDDAPSDGSEYVRKDGAWEVSTGVAVPDATDSVKGKVELATSAEAITGADTTRAVTPAGVKAAIDASGGTSVPHIVRNSAPSAGAYADGTIVFVVTSASGTTSTGSDHIIQDSVPGTADYADGTIVFVVP